MQANTNISRAVFAFKDDSSRYRKTFCESECGKKWQLWGGFSVLTSSGIANIEFGCNELVLLFTDADLNIYGICFYAELMIH